MKAAIFTASGIRWRVALLEKGVPIEDVAMLLRNSVQVALAHDAPWVNSRQDRLEESVKLAWS